MPMKELVDSLFRSLGGAHGKTAGKILLTLYAVNRLSCPKVALLVFGVLKDSFTAEMASATALHYQLFSGVFRLGLIGSSFEEFAEHIVELVTARIEAGQLTEESFSAAAEPNALGSLQLLASMVSGSLS